VAAHGFLAENSAMRFSAKLRLVVCALALAWAPGALAEDAEISSRDLVLQMGRAAFLRHCAACHGQGGRGDGPVAASLRAPPADLTRIAARRAGSFPVAELTEIVDGRRAVPAHGPREMPVWGVVFSSRIHEASSEDEVARGRLLVLVEYLRSIQRDAPR
jgi:mono/diheme cytochrome c family protein